ncbi:hypothetical protein [Streptomyces griseoaurantiacus]|uniref:hypothetical protein n=1 Tax=Streptomyces griseoaurantiacus TaxID=68213 RepID=UPI003686A5D2
MTTTDTATAREHRAAVMSRTAYPLAEHAVSAFVHEMPHGGALRIPVADGAPETIITRDDLHAVAYSGHTTVTAYRAIRDAAEAHITHGTREVHMIFPALGMRPPLYLADLLSVLDRRQLENAERTARSIYPRALSFVHAYAHGTRPNVIAGYTFVVPQEDKSVRYGWADGNNGMGSPLWDNRRSAEHALTRR